MGEEESNVIGSEPVPDREMDMDLPPHPEEGEGEAPPESPPRALSVAAVASLLTVAGLIGWAFAPEWHGLYETWVRDPNYSHGFLVVPLALAILWRRLRMEVPEEESLELKPWWPAWGILALILVARGVLHERGNQWGEVFTLLPVLLCLTLTFGGWRLLGRAWPAIAYLIFMIPLPARLDNAVAGPLQKLATSASCGLLKVTGLWVMAEGNVIHVGDNGASRLEVATACNGLSMLVTLAATVAALVLLVSLRPWKQLVLLASILPIALLSNVLRIAATGWCYVKYGPVTGEKFAHDAAGFLMMPVALVLVGLEMALLNWMIVDEEVVEEPLILGRPIAKGRRVAAIENSPQSQPPPSPSPTPEGPSRERGRGRENWG